MACWERTHKYCSVYKSVCDLKIHTHTMNHVRLFKNRFMWKTLSRRLLQAKTSPCCSLPRTFRIYLIHHSSWKRSACQCILIYFAKCLHNVHLALRCSVRIEGPTYNPAFTWFPVGLKSFFWLRAFKSRCANETKAVMQIFLYSIAWSLSSCLNLKAL